MARKEKRKGDTTSLDFFQKSQTSITPTGQRLNCPLKFGTGRGEGKL